MALRNTFWNSGLSLFLLQGCSLLSVSPADRLKVDFQICRNDVDNVVGCGNVMVRKWEKLAHIQRKVARKVRKLTLADGEDLSNFRRADVLFIQPRQTWRPIIEADANLVDDISTMHKNFAGALLSLWNYDTSMCIIPNDLGLLSAWQANLLPLIVLIR